MRILFLIPSLGYSGASRQLEILARGLSEEDLQVEVCQLGQETSTSAALREAGVAVHSLNWRRTFDVAPLWRLAKLLREFQPDLIHAWHPLTLRTLGLVGKKLLPRVVLSEPFRWHEGSRLTKLDQWLLRRVARVVVHGEAEAHLGQRQGLFLDKIAVIPPGVVGATVTEVPAPNRCERNIVCIGPLQGHKGYRDALWAFDILHHLFADVRLVFVGEGPEEVPLQRFAQALECDDLLRFVGDQPHVSQVLEQADICWVPSRRGGGTQAALEGMLAGRPVIACQVPNLDGLIVDGHSGCLVPPGDKVALARRTRELLLDPTLAARLGANARQRALSLFAPTHLVRRCRRIYQQVAA